ncbi:MAG TPA: hypothetical protein VM077_03195 [Candidatus Limnocylindrales bacterium]|nr:hypothetical protein [Candidatus Limnocylindrales bacterium]
MESISEKVASGRVRKGTLELLLPDADPPLEYRATFENPTGNGSIRTSLSPDLERLVDLPKGDPVMPPGDGKFYRKYRPDNPDPIAKEGDIIEPNGDIYVFEEGKGQAWPPPLDPVENPNGIRITKFKAVDGQDVTADTVIFYAERL